MDKEILDEIEAAWKNFEKSMADLLLTLSKGFNQIADKINDEPKETK
jgi:hypothetical protein